MNSQKSLKRTNKNSLKRITKRSISKKQQQNKQTSLGKLCQEQNNENEYSKTKIASNRSFNKVLKQPLNFASDNKKQFITLKNKKYSVKKYIAKELNQQVKQMAGFIIKTTFTKFIKSLQKKQKNKTHKQQYLKHNKSYKKLELPLIQQSNKQTQQKIQAKQKLFQKQQDNLQCECTIWQNVTSWFNKSIQKQQLKHIRHKQSQKQTQLNKNNQIKEQNKINPEIHHEVKSQFMGIKFKKQHRKML